MSPLDTFFMGVLLGTIFGVGFLASFGKDCAAPIMPCPSGYVNIQERGEVKCVQESGVQGWSHDHQERN